MSARAIKPRHVPLRSAMLAPGERREWIIALPPGWVAYHLALVPETARDFRVERLEKASAVEVELAGGPLVAGVFLRVVNRAPSLRQFVGEFDILPDPDRLAREAAAVAEASWRETFDHVARAMREGRLTLEDVLAELAKRDRDAREASGLWKKKN
jgi:hypothetical protein